MTTHPTPPATAPSAQPVECSVNFKLERRNFEKWHKKHRYVDRENAWQVWQARAEITAKPPADLRAELDAITAERDKWQTAWQAGRAPLLARIAELENELLAQREKNVLLSVCLRQVEDGEGK